MKSLASVLCALAVSLAGAQVTYRTTGATVAKVVAEVAKSADQKLTVDKDLAKEIVVVSVKDVPLEEFKKRLADCVSGKWVEKDNGDLELRVDATLSADRQKSAQENYAKSIPGQIKSSLEMYGQEGMGAIRQDTPSVNELALQIGKRLKESDYERILPHSRIVFSTNPHRGQLRLPDISDLIAEFLPAERGRLITKITFAIERPFLDAFTRYGLYGFDQQGRLRSFTYISLVSVQKARAPVLAGTQIKWSPASQELAKQFGNWGHRASSGLLNIPDFLRDALSKPTEIDPITFGFGEGILACADEKQDHVIACIADQNVSGTFAMGVPGTTTGEFWSQVQATLVSERSSGWVIVRPRDPISAREHRGDRVALQKLITSTRGHVWPSLENVAEFAASNLKCADMPTAFSLPYQVLINSYGTIGTSYGSNFRPLQLYACLSTPERMKLRAGESLLSGSLSPKAKEVLNAIIFDPNGAVLDFSIKGEPTEIMPLGLSNDLLLSANVTSSYIIAPLPDAGDPTMPPTAMSMRDIAQNRGSPKSPFTEDVPELTRMRVGNRLEWKISLNLAGKVIGSVSLADDSVPKDAKPTTMEALPQNIKDLLEKAYQNYLKEMGGGG